MDMADKYPPAESFEDDRPTVEVNMREQYPDLFDDDDEPTLVMSPLRPAREKRYPGIGLLISLGVGLAFWGTLAYFIFR